MRTPPGAAGAPVGQGSRLLLPVLCLLAALLPGAPARGQGRVFGNLVGVEVQQLSNAVRVILTADGTVQLRYNTGEWVDWARAESGPIENAIKPVQVIRFRLTNLRSQTGSFFDVGVYPVSHVEVSIPAEDPDGIGLDIAIPLYVPARLNGVRAQDDEFDFWERFPPPAFDIRQSEDQRSIIVTVLSDRQAQTPEVRKSPQDVEKLRQVLEMAPSPRGFTLRALNTNLVNLAQALSAASGVSVSVAEGVNRYVSLYLEDMPLPDLLQTLARAYGLDMLQESGGYALVESAPGTSAAFATGVTEAVPLENVSALQAADLFPDFLRRYLRPDPTSNSLIVSGPKYLVDKIRQDARKIDTRPLQIEVEMVALEYSRTFDLESALGLRTQGPGWSFSSDSLVGDLSFENTGTRPADFSLRLQRLEARGAARIRARSRTTALSGGSAEVFVGQERVIQVTEIVWDRIEGRALKVNVGVRLHCHPRSADGKEIIVRLEPEVNTLAGVDPVTGMPEIVRRQGRGTLCMQSGDLVFVGGLTNDLETVRKRRIPILGSLPIIGGLFRSRRVHRETAALGIFMSARVVNGDSTIGG